MRLPYLKITLAPINGVWRRVPGIPGQCSPKEEITVGLVNSLVLEMERSGMNLRYRIGETLTYSDR